MEAGRVAGLVLAAGSGRRIGGPKALARDPDGTPWVVRTARVLADAGCEPVTVVVGADAAAVTAVLDEEPVEIVEAIDWEEGMGASLRTGLAAFSQHRLPTAVVVVPVDLPGLLPDAVLRVTADPDPSSLARATYRGVPGHPVLIGRDHWGDVAARAVGDQGARGFLNDHPPLEIECADLDDGLDVDRAEQLPAGHTLTASGGSSREPRVQ